MFLFFPPLLLIFRLTYTVIWRPWPGPPECFHSAVWSPASHFICVSVCLNTGSQPSTWFLLQPASSPSDCWLGGSQDFWRGRAAAINAPYMWNKMAFAVCSPEPRTVFLALFSKKLSFLDSCFSESVSGLLAWPESMFSVILHSRNP